MELQRVRHNLVTDQQQPRREILHLVGEKRGKILKTLSVVAKETFLPLFRIQNLQLIEMLMVSTDWTEYGL